MDRAFPRSDQAGQMDIVYSAAMTPLQLGMNGHFPAAMMNAHDRVADHDPDPFPDQPPGHRIGVSVDGHRAVGADAANQVAVRRERGRAVQRPERPGLVAPEAIPRRLTGRAVNADIGDVAGPGFEMGLQRRPAPEAPACDGIPLHIADAALVLPLRPGPIRSAGPDPETPVLREAFRRTIAETSSGVFISSLRGKPNRGEISTL